jgi:hypothetical protein
MINGVSADKKGFYSGFKMAPSGVEPGPGILKN